jgi:hypothetical protein
VWETHDPEGRKVVLLPARWSHVTSRHPYLDVEPQVVLETVAEPDARVPGHRPGEEWYYRRSVGPSAWIRVVVHYEHGEGRIVTAFPRRAFP